MSRQYSMRIAVCNFQPDRRNAVKAAVEEEWDLGWHTLEPDLLEGDGDGNLVAGETDGEFAQRVARAVWEANDGYCPVTVVATCLEDLPYAEYPFSEADFERLLAETVNDEPPA